MSTLLDPYQNGTGVALWNLNDTLNATGSLGAAVIDYNGGTANFSKDKFVPGLTLSKPTKVTFPPYTGGACTVSANFSITPGHDMSLESYPFYTSFIAGDGSTGYQGEVQLKYGNLYWKAFSNSSATLLCENVRTDQLISIMVNTNGEVYYNGDLFYTDPAAPFQKMAGNGILLGGFSSAAYPDRRTPITVAQVRIFNASLTSGTARDMHQEAEEMFLLGPGDYLGAQPTQAAYFVDKPVDKIYKGNSLITDFRKAVEIMAKTSTHRIYKVLNGGLNAYTINGTITRVISYLTMPTPYDFANAVVTKSFTVPNDSNQNRPPIVPAHFHSDGLTMSYGFDKSVGLLKFSSQGLNGTVLSRTQSMSSTTGYYTHGICYTGVSMLYSLKYWSYVGDVPNINATPFILNVTYSDVKFPGATSVTGSVDFSASGTIAFSNVQGSSGKLRVYLLGVAYDANSVIKYEDIELDNMHSTTIVSTIVGYDDWVVLGNSSSVSMYQLKLSNIF